MKIRILFVAAAIVAALGGIGAGLYPLIRVAPELVAGERARLTAPTPGAPQKPWDFWTVEVEALTAELKDTRQALAERSVALESRANQIAADGAELERTRGQIETMRRELDERIFRLEESESRNLRNLAITYSALEPAAAIAILSQVEETTVVKIFALMKPDAVAAIFNEMGRAGATPETLRRAASLSEKLRLFDRETADRS